MPDAFVTFMWLVISAGIGVGGVYGFIYLGWHVYYEVQLMEDRKRVAKDLVEAQAEHQQKLLDLEFQKAKAMSDQLAAAAQE